MSTELTIVIPILKNNQPLESELTLISQALIKFSINAEVILVSNNTNFHLNPEKYQQISGPTLLKLRAVVTPDSSAKLGRLFRLGTSISDSRFVLYLLPEGKFDPQFIPKGLNLLRSGSSLVLANRFHNQNKASHGAASIFRKQRFLRSLFSIIGITNLPQDFTNSSRMFDKYIFDALAISGNNWDMFAELTIKCVLAKTKIESIEVAVKDFKTENDFQITFLEAFLGLIRLVPRAFMHKLKISWF
jgi:hypothetical protein